MPSARARALMIAIVSVLLSGCRGTEVSPALLEHHGDPISLGSRAAADAKALQDSIATVLSAQPLQRAGLDSVLETYVNLGRLPVDVARAEGRTVRVAGRPPLQFFPRLTAPAFVELDRSPGVDGWVVPVLLNRMSFRWSRWRGCLPAEKPLPVGGGSEIFWFLDNFTDWYDDERTQVEKHLVCHLSFWLEGHPGWDWQPNRRPLPLRCDPIRLSSFRETLPDARPDICGLALHVPAGSCPPGFYNVRVLPRVYWRTPNLECGGCRSSTELAAALQLGDWYSVEAHLPDLICRFKEHTLQNVETLVEALEEFVLPYFADGEFAVIAEALEEFASEIEDEKRRELALSPPGGDWRYAGSPLGPLARAVRSMFLDDLLPVQDQPAPAPVLLDEAHDAEDEFSFIVAADTQYHGNLTELRQFLAALDPGLHERLDPLTSSANLPGLPTGANRLELLEATTLTHIRKAKFVLIAGDLADGAAGSAPLALAGNYLGLLPPTSPYFQDDTGGEFQDLRREFRRFGKPIVAVPGNHDGYVGYAGIGNLPLDFLGGEVFESSFIGDALLTLNEAIPALARLRVSDGRAQLGLFGFDIIDYPGLLELARYDGLNAFQHILGPLNVAFRFRERSFVGLNSYHLPQAAREGSGAVVFNWGGGVTEEDVAWFNCALEYHRERGNGRQQFVFMHHDPRAVTPSAASFADGSYGSYHHLDSWMNLATGGYLGLGYSSKQMLYLPIITPTFNYLFHLSAQSESQQEWMRGPYVPSALQGVADSALRALGVNEGSNDCYGARQLIGSINRNLACDQFGNLVDGVSAIFFGHDNVPSAPGYWSVRGHVFPPEQAWSHSRWTPKALAWGIWPWTRNPNSVAPEWTETCFTAPGRNARVVRLDDVGDAFGRDHGFHVVTVKGDQVTIEYVRLP